MTKANTTATGGGGGSGVTSPENSVKNDKKKRVFSPSSKFTIFLVLLRISCDGFGEEDIIKGKRVPGGRAFLYEKKFLRQTSAGIEGLNLSNFEQSMAQTTEIREIRIFVATWNVGGKTPNYDLNLEDFLLADGSADIYVCGFQEIVPLSAGNVLVIEDNEPAAKWLALICQALNKAHHDSVYSSPVSGPTSKNPCTNNFKDSKHNNFFHKPSLKLMCKSFRADTSLLKTCNCPVDSTTQDSRRLIKLSDFATRLDLSSLPMRNDGIAEYLLSPSGMSNPYSPRQMSYCLISSKQMVGIFLSIWVRKELIPYIGHLRVSSIGRGIMGCLGNKGCIAISMTLHQTSFCFLCCHLASGEKEGNELKRNADVTEILKNTQFSKICKGSNCLAPEKIIDHDRVIWFGDLNYRVSLSYEDALVLLENNDWDTMLAKDQLRIEREAGRAFTGFKEGRILFAPTYKYSHNSDSYAGENVKSKKKRRTPAWCDRILWRGQGIEQLSYIRGESRLSDHRPVCAVFSVEVEVRSKTSNRFRKGYSCMGARLEYEDCIPQRHSFYEF
ncbi:hypothetical protein SLEP1_g34800 [Rubroshorea leprosula]|nr:hypothetical protein SLEP1_g34800 [Rubroshorea leprosula]